MELPKPTTVSSSNGASKSSSNTKSKRISLYRPPVASIEKNFDKCSRHNSLQEIMERSVVKSAGCHALRLHYLHFIYMFLTLIFGMEI